MRYFTSLFLVLCLALSFSAPLPASASGKTAPQIEYEKGVITKVTDGHILAPTHCPSCHTPLIQENKFLKCPNTQKCPAQILGSLRLFCDSLEIKGISDKTIAKLYQLNLINYMRLKNEFKRFSKCYLQRIKAKLLL